MCITDFKSIKVQEMKKRNLYVYNCISENYLGIVSLKHVCKIITIITFKQLIMSKIKGNVQLNKNEVSHK